MLIISVDDFSDFRRWLLGHGYDMQKNITGSSMLSGGEGVDHYETSLWHDHCHFGDWTVRADDDVVLSLICGEFQPKGIKERLAEWGVLIKLLESSSQESSESSLLV